ncbi:MAG: DUF1801 domain-containing protein [Myxococcales bacterium]|nr:DUF1801 domain-containing protein [Myxococcales bacterium]
MEPTEWIGRQPEGARDLLTTLDERIRRAGPSLAVSEAGGMLVYGPFQYRYASGREGTSALVSIAVRKGGVAVYVNSVRDDGAYVAEARAAELGKVKVGKSCITVKKAKDLELDVFERVVAEAVEHGGAGAVAP